MITVRIEVVVHNVGAAVAAVEAVNGEHYTTHRQAMRALRDYLSTEAHGSLERAVRIHAGGGYEQTGGEGC